MTVRDQEQNYDVLVLHLVTRSHRLSRLLERLVVFLATRPIYTSQDKIAALTLQLLLGIVPDLFQLLEVRKIVELLAPALHICFSPQTPPPNMRRLAAIIADSGNLIELLSSHQSGSQAVEKWASLSNVAMQDPGCRTKWTSKLMNMAATCVGEHDAAAEIEQWNSLLSLSRDLHAINDSPHKWTTGQITDDRRLGFTSRFYPSASFPKLDETLVELLTEFQLPVPSSERTLRNIIDRLEGEKTTELFVAIAATYPCKLCNDNLHSTSFQKPDTAVAFTDRTITEYKPDLHLELLGEAVGTWRILLSVQALKSIQHRISSGWYLPVQRLFHSMLNNRTGLAAS